jgi:hypothetical protein
MTLGALCILSYSFASHAFQEARISKSPGVCFFLLRKCALPTQTLSGERTNTAMGPPPHQEYFSKTKHKNRCPFEKPPLGPLQRARRCRETENTLQRLDAECINTHTQPLFAAAYTSIYIRIQNSLHTPSSTQRAPGLMRWRERERALAE